MCHEKWTVLCVRVNGTTVDFIRQVYGWGRVLATYLSVRHPREGVETGTDSYMIFENERRLRPEAVVVVATTQQQ